MPVECACLAFILFTQWVRDQYRLENKWMTPVLFVCTLLMIVEYIICLLADTYGRGVMSIITRPIVFCMLIRSLQN